MLTEALPISDITGMCTRCEQLLIYGFSRLAHAAVAQYYKVTPCRVGPGTCSGAAPKARPAAQNREGVVDEYYRMQNLHRDACLPCDLPRSGRPPDFFCHSAS